MARRGDVEGLKKILDAGYILVSSTGIKIPGRDAKDKYDLEVHLTGQLRERVRALIEASLERNTS